MTTVYQRERLFTHLGQFAYQSLAQATRLCRTFRHEFVELEHWLKVLLEQEQGDLPLLFSHYQLNPERIVERLDRILHTMPNRNTVVEDLSSQLESAVEKGLVISQLAQSGQHIRTSHILLGMLQDATLQRWLYRLNDEFKKIPLPQVFDEFSQLLQASIEHPSCPDADVDTEAAVASHSDSTLENWCQDMTQQALEGDIDPVIGREPEVRQVIDILLRRRQNNPILVGEAGVGKTAVVEALARRIAAGDVPPSLQQARLLSLDLGRMQAGASLRGEFESRLKALIDAIVHSPVPIILFCDEAHTLVGAGGQEGTGDAVNLLKPMLARGTLRMVGATTWSEYKQFIEPDAALTRRFQPVMVNEPDEESAINMLRAIAPHFAAHHGVIVRESAIRAAVHLSLRNLPSRLLPDKAISLLDTACARVALSQHATPSAIENLQATLVDWQTEMRSLEQEQRWGATPIERRIKLEQLMFEAELKLGELQTDYQQAKQLLPLSSELVGSDEQQYEHYALRCLQLEALQQEMPLIHPWVTERVIADVLSDWTGIPSGRMLQNDVDNALQLEQILGQHIFGQQGALAEIAQAVRISRAGIQAPEQPLGVFLLAGPTGVGKTETAHALAAAMYGGSHNLITFNMSEFQESHTVSTLKGAPPGYVGYGKGGKLTEAVRRKPYSVLLLDEFEKAHPDIHEAFYQVFDKGLMEDGEGRQVSFRQCFILVTCNVGADEIEQAVAQQQDIRPSVMRPLVYDALARVFPPALLARMQIIPYLPLTPQAITHIAQKQLSAIQQRLQQEQGITLSLHDEVAEWVASRVAVHPSRGRAVSGLLQQTLLPAVSNELLKRQRQGTALQQVRLVVQEQQLAVEFD